MNAVWTVAHEKSPGLKRSDGTDLFNNRRRPLFDFDRDLYGRTIEVMLHHYLRPEAKFADLDALTGQMAKDAEQAQQLLSSSLPPT